MDRLPIDRLQEIFDRQRELMGRFHPIEVQNGLPRPELPIKLDLHTSQDRLRGLAWHVMEEFVETIQASEEKGRHDLVEELADTFHFLVELALTIGFSPHNLVRSDRENAPDSLEYLYYAAEQYFPETAWPAEPAYVYLNFILCLGNTMHALKNKPWKQTAREVDILVLFSRMRITLIAFTEVCRWHGVGSWALYEAYLGKSLVNHNRIDSGV